MREASIKRGAGYHFAFQDTRFLNHDRAGKPRLKARQAAKLRQELCGPQPENGIARIG
jgi:hypothetical protein